MPYRYAAQNGRVGIDDYVIFYYRVSRLVDRVAVGVELETLCPKGDSLVETYVVADNASLADYNACAVVYAEIIPDFRLRMNVNSCAGVGHLRDHSRNYGYSYFRKNVCETVMSHCYYRGIAKNHFLIILCRGIGVENCFYVSPELTFQFWDLSDDIGCRFLTQAYVLLLIISVRIA